MGPIHQQQQVQPKTAELSVGSMQAALSTAAALAAAGATVNSPQTQIRAAATAQQQQRMVVQQQGTTTTSIAPIAPILATSMTTAPPVIAPAATSSTHKSLYAAYNAVTQQPVAPQPPTRVPILFPANAHVIPATTAPAQPSSIFDTMKLRRGKWTSEEEAYAELLINEFEKGTVDGCENGCTLRSFLSKKLHCAPMRISKKYAGKFVHVW